MVNIDEELLDVVNADDEVIGRRTRREIHEHRLLHRASHVLVFNRDQQLLLQKRAMSKDCNPGLWDSSVSGHVDSSESYDECALRELREEIGLVPAVRLERFFKVPACPETGNEFVWVYRLQAHGPFAVNCDEIDRVEWFDQAMISAWIAAAPEQLTGSFRLIWSRFSRLAHAVQDR